MAEIPKDNRLLTSQPASTGVNPFDNPGIKPRTTPASIGKGSNDTAPVQNKGWSTKTDKCGYNEPC